MRKFFLSAVIACLLHTGSSFAQITVLSQNFESTTLPSLPAGWTETHTGGGQGWVTNRGLVRWSVNNLQAHTNYCMVDDAHHFTNMPAKLTTPSFSLVGLANPHLIFDCVFNEMFSCTGCQQEQGWVEVSTDGGSTYSYLHNINLIGGQWTTLFYDLSAVTPSANCKLRFCYTDSGVIAGQGLLGIAIDNIAVYSAAPFDAGLSTLEPEVGHVETYVPVGSSVYFNGFMSNCGTDSFHSYSISYQVGASAPVTQTFPYGIPAYSLLGYYFLSPYTVTAVGPQQVKAWITVAGDANHANDTLTTTIIGIDPATMPAKKVLIEEMTGTWCGWCVRGTMYMDSLWKADSNLVSISSVHSHPISDPMAADNASSMAYDIFTTTVAAAGYPNVIRDRRSNDDPAWIFSDLGYDSVMFAFADVSVSHTISGGALTATATIKPAIDLTGDYRLELIVTEQDVVGGTMGYNQANAYSGYTADSIIGCGYNFNVLPSPVPASMMDYHFVARYTLPADLVAEPNGVAGSLPATLTAGTTYTYTFAPVPTPGTWNSAKLSCIAVLIDNTQFSPINGVVLNSANNSRGYIPQHLSVDNLQHTVTFDIAPNPASSSTTLSFNLQESVVTTVEVYDMTGRKVLTQQVANATSGNNKIVINTTMLAPGVYNTVLAAGNNRVSKMLTITR